MAANHCNFLLNPQKRAQHTHCSIAFLSKPQIICLLVFSTGTPTCLHPLLWDHVANRIGTKIWEIDQKLSNSSHLEDIFCALWVCLADRGRGATHLCWLSSLDKPFPPQNVTRWSPFFSQEPPKTAPVEGWSGSMASVEACDELKRGGGGGGWTWPRWRERGFGWETWGGGVRWRVDNGQ